MRRQLAKFAVVGAATVAVDFLIYRSLLHFDFATTNVAKAAGFVAGLVFAYFANRFCTFASHTQAPGSVRRFLALYILTLMLNVAVNAAVLRQLHDIRFAIQYAFLAATGMSACLNFLGMKYFVFKLALERSLR